MGRQGLEWEIPSPPPTENFTVTPIVTEGTHQYAPEPGGRHCLTHARRAFSRADSPAARRVQRGRDPAARHTSTPHHPKLQHHFDDMEQQDEASTLGMWVFLVTEIMFFGGLFMAYLVYRVAVAGRRSRRPARTSSIGWGGVNTVVLIVSSLTMALAVRAAQTSEPREDAGRAGS